MSFFTWMDSRIQQMHWIDISMVKLSTAAAILMIAKLWEPLLSLDWYWYGGIFVLAAVKPCCSLLKKPAV